MALTTFSVMNLMEMETTSAHASLPRTTRRLHTRMHTAACNTTGLASGGISTQHSAPSISIHFMAIPGLGFLLRPCPHPPSLQDWGGLDEYAMSTRNIGGGWMSTRNIGGGG